MTDHPSKDEIEVSLFGPGYGESILLHLGNGDWIAVDSCIDPKDASSVPLRYLKSLGVDLSSQIKMIIATHWHDDHIRGIAELLHVCNSAKFGLATVFTKEDFIQFATANSSSDPSPLGRTTTEIMSVVQLLKSRKQKPVFLTADRKIYSTAFSQSTIDASVFSLSPTDDVMNKFLLKVAAAIPAAKTPQRRSGDLKPNEVSAVILINLPNGAVLLGADLEESHGKAWTKILQNSVCLDQKATIFKIPHHGSKTGHCDDVWNNLLSRNVIAILAPWNKGRKLPSRADINRILSLTSEAYSTADPNAVAPIRRDPQVKRSLDNMGIRLRLAQPRPGHIRLRRKAGEVNWSIKSDGTARHLKSI